MVVDSAKWTQQFGEYRAETKNAVPLLVSKVFFIDTFLLAILFKHPFYFTGWFIKWFEIMPNCGLYFERVSYSSLLGYACN